MPAVSICYIFLRQQSLEQQQLAASTDDGIQQTDPPTADAQTDSTPSVLFRYPPEPPAQTDDEPFFRHAESVSFPTQGSQLGRRDSAIDQQRVFASIEYARKLDADYGVAVHKEQVIWTESWKRHVRDVQVLERVDG
ncbi:hypothetical protein LTR66_005637 [Elasticomyces elasticus]|nr:hypothetical protein LTR66_005637 [Elasticomyces elasticus]